MCKNCYQLFILWLAAPAPTCTSVHSANGVITVMWSYVHTGGLPLTSVSVVYRFEEGLAMSSPTDVDIANIEVMRAMVSNLIAGRLYTFTITTENSNGSTSIDCGPVRHDVGKYNVISFNWLSFKDFVDWYVLSPFWYMHFL